MRARNNHRRWLSPVTIPPPVPGSTTTPLDPAREVRAGGPWGTTSDMSESTSENESGQGITDDQLPDDLNPDKNPLADPDADKGDSSDDSDGPGAEGMPDMGQPG
jgi:hypothetical protein